MSLPAGTNYYIEIKVNHLRMMGNFSHFPYQINLSDALVNDPFFKNEITTANNIAVYDPIGDVLKPRIVELDLPTNNLLIAFDASTSTVEDLTWFVCVGPEISEVDDPQVFANSGYGESWGFHEPAGTSPLYCRITPHYLLPRYLQAPAVLGVASKFGTGILHNQQGRSYDNRAAGVSPMDEATKFTWELLWEKSSVGNYFPWFLYAPSQNVYPPPINSIVLGFNNYTDVQKLVCFLKTQFASGYGYFDMSSLPDGVTYHIVWVFDGTLTGNENRLKLFIDGVQQSITITGTVYSKLSNLSGSSKTNTNYMDGPEHTFTTPMQELSLAPVVLSPEFILTRSNQFLVPDFWSKTFAVVNFTGLPVKGEIPLSVQFTDKTEGIVGSTWLWNFGDGETSILQHPLHIYLLPNIYTVSLLVNGIGSLVREDYISVYEIGEGDILFGYDSIKGCSDVHLDIFDLKRDSGFETAVLISLFTDKRAEDSDKLPNNQIDRRGWWADNNLGSKLWLIEREKLLNEAKTKAEQYSKEALQWLIEEGIAETVLTEAVLVRGETALTLNIQIIQKSGEPIYFKYYYNWEAQIARRA